MPTNTDNVFITTPGTYAVVVDSYGANVFVNITNLTLGAGGGAAGVQTLYVTNTLIGFNVLNSMLITGGGAFTAGADYTSAGAATMTVANGGVLTVNAFHASFYIAANLVVTNGGVVYANNYPYVGAGSTPMPPFRDRLGWKTADSWWRTTLTWAASEVVGFRSVPAEC